MNAIYLLIKLFLFGIVGFYILEILGDKNKKYLAPLSIWYTLFSLITIENEPHHVLLTFLLGIFWGVISNIFISLVDEDFKVNINPIMFGILSLINSLFLNPLFDRFIISSSKLSLEILLFCQILIFLPYLACFLRKNI